jgi:DNA invertase Pin-like site-specific DNA recombinase
VSKVFTTRPKHFLVKLSTSVRKRKRRPLNNMSATKLSDQGRLRAARTHVSEFIIAESLSRVARDQEDAPAIRKHLTFAGVRLATPTDGVVIPLMHGPAHDHRLAIP